MIKTGIIKTIGQPSKWTTDEGEERFTYPVTVGIPYVRQDGKQGEDELVCDHHCSNPDYVKQLEKLMEQQAECDLTISFKTKDYKGRLYNKVVLRNISQKIG